MEILKKHDQRAPEPSTAISNEQFQPYLSQENRIHTLKKSQTFHSGDFYKVRKSKTNNFWNSTFIFHPNHAFRVIWDLIILACLLYLVISIPVFIFFVIQVEGDWIYVEFVVQILFVMDIFVTVNTGYFYKGALVMIRTMMAKQYAERWLFLDLMSSFPWVWLLTGSVFEDQQISFSETKNSFSSIKLSRLVRFLKLLKVFKMEKILLDIDDYFKTQLASIWFLFIKLFSRVILIAHWAACLFFYVSLTNMTKRNQNWLIDFQEDVESGIPKMEFYVTSMYWAITTMVSVGYGDFHPISIVEKLYGIFSMVCLSAMFVNIIGNLSSLISEANAREDRYRFTVQAVNRYMKKKNLPSEIQFRVRSYLDYTHEVNNDYDYDEQNILDIFSGPLKDEIYQHLHGHVIKSCILFTSGLFSRELVIHLPRLLTYQAYAAEDQIFEEGETSRTLYFIMSGEVEVYHPTSKVCYTNLEADEYFGEIGFLIGAPRCAAVKSTRFTEVFSMTFYRFYDILCTNPEDDKSLMMIAKKCLTMDYTYIHISCYLCKMMGHVAARCKNLIFNLDQEHTRNIWLEGRKIRGRKIPFHPENQLDKRGHKARQVFAGCFNDRDTAFSRYKGHESLMRKVENYYIENSMETGESPHLFDKTRKEDIKSKRRFSVIYQITESDEENIEDTVRQPIFDMSLLGNSIRIDSSKIPEASLIGSSIRDDDTRSEIKD
ncbi:unnamed protein product [Blepharisma stoltei]|uniref:Cyclic nucleotide-binding domain-containing protein n=1 Tax=Blepharisma stoltei TaxID=1481888 RepID=A0AAU9IFH0_9CILI|nr:unnamed protein product [Blepharisma stoltei]